MSAFTDPIRLGPGLSAIANIVFYTIAAMLLLLIGTGCLAFVPFGPFGGPFAVMVILIATSVAVSRVRRARSRVVTGYVQMAIDNNVPLVQFLRAAADAERGATRKRLDKIATAIGEGQSLGAALAAHLPELDERDAHLLGRTTELGQTRSLLDWVTRHERDRIETNEQGSIIAVAYATVVVLGLGLILGAVNIFILPKYVYIFEDFDTTMPWITQAIVDLGPGISMVLAIVMVLVGLAVCGISLGNISTTRFGPIKIFQHIREGFVGMLPVFGSAVRSRAMAQSLMVLRAGLGSGLPLHEAAAYASRATSASRIAGKWQRFSERAAAGGTIPEACRAGAFGPMVTGMLTSAAYAETFDPTLTFLQRYYDLKFSRLLAVIEQLFLPCTVLALAVLVGTFVVAMFLPLVKLIEANF